MNVMSFSALKVLAPQRVSSVRWGAKLWEYCCNASLAACYMIFSWGMLSDFTRTHRLSSLILTVFETLIVFYSLCRPAPKQTNKSIYDWTVALAGTFILLLLRPAPQVHDHPAVLAVQLT